MKLIDLVETVDSRDSFLEFLRALEDREDEDSKEKIAPSSPYSSGVNGWQNQTISEYLESMFGWLEDSEVEEELSWKLIAKMLYMGKIYE